MIKFSRTNASLKLEIFGIIRALTVVETSCLNGNTTVCKMDGIMLAASQKRMGISLKAQSLLPALNWWVLYDDCCMCMKKFISQALISGCSF